MKVKKTTKKQLAAEARARGDIRFLAGCNRHGENVEHYTGTPSCVACTKEANARTYARHKNDPTNFRVYLLVCEAAGIAYIGSTKIPMRQRKAVHFHELKEGIHSNPGLRRAYAGHGRGAFSCAVLAEFPGDTIDELRRFEQFYIDAGEIRGLRLVNVQRAAAAKKLESFKAFGGE